MHGYDTYGDTMACGLELPGDNVRVVLHDGDNDLVAGTHESLDERRGDKIGALCRAAREDDLIGRAGVDEAADCLAGRLMEVGGLLGEVVDTTVDIGVDIIILVGHGLYDTAGLLCRGGIVKIDEGTVIDLAAENGEVGTHFLDIVHGSILVLRREGQGRGTAGTTGLRPRGGDGVTGGWSSHSH